MKQFPADEATQLSFMIGVGLIIPYNDIISHNLLVTFSKVGSWKFENLFSCSPTG